MDVIQNLKNKKIFFATSATAPWIDQDLAFFSNLTETYSFFATVQNYLKLSWLRPLFYSDLVVIWFASLRLLPLAMVLRLLSKKVVLIVGGYDVAHDAETNHGAFDRGPFSRRMRLFVLNSAQLWVAVSDFNRQEAIRNAGLPESKVEVISLGFASPKPAEVPCWGDREKCVVGIFSVPSFLYVSVKGLDEFVQLARELPDWIFYHMGLIPPEIMVLVQPVPPNIQWLGYLPHGGEKFESILRKSRFVVQLSRYESFCAAVVDGALRGCLPIVSDRGALPEVSKDFGRIFPLGNHFEIVEFIRTTSASAIDSQRIADLASGRFHENIRWEKFKALVARLA